MKIYTIHGIDMIHISEFALALNRSITSTRHLVEEGNKVRKLKYFRDRSRLMIATTEITGFPFTNGGPHNLDGSIFHYRKLEGGRYERYMCPECTFGDKCEARKIADAVVMPEGDK